jgi:uncharacterized membrane protein YphA (DoxX/SURF4 family)
MSALAFAARIVLAAAFVVAAVAKLRDRSGVEAQMRELVGTRAAPVAARFVPTVELALGAALLLARSSPVPGALALTVLLVFTGVLVRAQARRVPCPCFGGAPSSRPVGPPAVLRNGVLLALAVLATADASNPSVLAVVVWTLVLAVPTAIAVRAAR